MQRLGHFLSVSLHTLLWCLAIGVLTQNVVLIRQSRQLRVSTSTQASDVEAGRQLDNLAAVSLEGVLTPINLPPRANERLLVIAMSPGCPYSRASKDGFMALSTNLRKRGNWKVVWVSRDSVQVTRIYCEQNGIELKGVLADPTHKTFVQLGLDKVPRMIVIRPDGIVEKVWGGALNNTLMKDISAYFGGSRSAF